MRRSEAEGSRVGEAERTSEAKWPQGAARCAQTEATERHVHRREMPGNKADGGKMAVQPQRTRARRQSRECREMRRSEAKGSSAGEAERTSEAKWPQGAACED